MLYFSEMVGKKVQTEDAIVIGTLKDCIFLASDRPLITKFVITSHSADFILPIEDVKKINSVIVISKAYTIGELQENELYIKKNLLDKQIIDITGNKIVRVNDVAMQERISTTDYELLVSGVDIGLLGIIRRLKIESFVFSLLNPFGLKPTSEYLSWADIQPLDLSQGKVRLKKDQEKLQNIHPEDLADYLEQTNETNVRKFLKILDIKVVAQVVNNLNINYQRALFQHWAPEKAAQLIEMIDPVESVDILLALTKRKREEIVTLLKPDKKDELTRLIHLSTTKIGSNITSEYLTVSPTTTVKEAIEKIKTQTADYSFLGAVYVLNNKDELVGVFNLHDMLIHEIDTPVYKFMVQNIIEIRVTTPIEIVVRKMLKYHLPALPVVHNKKMIGVITFDQVVDYLTDKLK